MPSRIPSPNALVALALFVLSLGVYAYCSSPTINFWDCGEFVSTSHHLGIPHQPGTPLYVLVGRVFSMLPLFGLTVAKKINLMSGFFAALAVAFSYLTTMRLIGSWRDELEDPMPAWMRRAAAASGALFLAFSTTFWINAIEAEVYSIASFVLAFTAYLSIRWYESQEREASATLVLIIIYVMGLSIGFHLGSILVYPGVFLLILISSRKVLRNVDLIIVSLAMGAFVASAIMKWGFVSAILFAVACLAAIWRMLTWGSKDESARGAYFAAAGIALFVLGISVHLIMLIRAGQDPFINQSQPETFDALMSVLRREQYPPRSLLVREAPWLWQLGHMWGSSIWQGGSLAGRTTIGYLQQFTIFSKPGVIDVFLPLALWLFGLVSQFAGNRKLFWSFLAHLFFNSIFLLLYLNFNDHEVRDRDYFYFGFFQFLTIFIGLGVAGVVRLLWQTLRAPSPLRFVPPALAVIFVVLPALPAIQGSAHTKFYEHDRRKNTIARDYAHNILTGLPENAILFTNGDNDTFPLWYMQDVEGFRRDVRVVNLSLINLPWYIKQLRDIEPKLPISLTDEQIDGEAYMPYRQWNTKLVAQELPNGEIAYVRDIVVWHVVLNNQWNRALYYAVTVPNENIGVWRPYLVMEGLVFKITQTASEDGRHELDTDKIWENFTEVYDLDSVLDENGMRRDDFFRDHQTNHLLNNYPAALTQAAYWDAVDLNYERAKEMAEMAYRVNPQFPVVADVLPMIYLQAGDIEAGIDAGNRLYDVLDAEGRVDVGMSVGEALLTLRQDEAAVRWAKSLSERDPEEPAYVQLLAQSYILAGDDSAAVRTLEDWIERTNDPNALRELDNLREEIRRAQEDSTSGADGSP